MSTGPTTSTPPARSCAGLGCLILMSGVGVLMLAVTVGSLYYNESHLIKSTRPLIFARENAVTVPAEAVDATNEGKLVHVTGRLQAAMPLRDEVFGIEARAITLSREVEVFQWVEITAGDTRSRPQPRYEQRWKDEFIDSSEFKEPAGHENPADRPFDDPDATDEPHGALDARIGVFAVRVDELGTLTKTPLYATTPPPPPEEIPAPPVYQGTEGKPMEGDWFYFGENSANPAMGDVRARFSSCKNREASLIGQQSSGSIEPYPAEDGQTIYLYEDSAKSVKDIVSGRLFARHSVAWTVRLISGFFLLITMAMSYQALRKAFSVLPILGTIFMAGGFAVIALGTLALYFLVIALPWLPERPLLGIALLALASVLLSTLHGIGSRKRRGTEDAYLKEFRRDGTV